MAEHRLLGKNFVPPDVEAKVTGRAKYAEDFRVEGMLHTKLLLSPMPHARVRNIDTRAAEAMEGVFAILTADEVPQSDNPLSEPALTNEPVYAGEPILAVAAVDEDTAAAAIEAIQIDLQPLPFVLDPLDSLAPRGPNARTQGNIRGDDGPEELKWSARTFAEAGEDRLPMGETPEEWSYGDIEAGFAEAAVIIERSLVTQKIAHHSMEPRSCMSYWDNGKVYMFTSTQSTGFASPGLARMLGVDLADLVHVAANCGGGFGSKASTYSQMLIPALLAKKTNRPVQLRVTRAEEYYFGKSRPGFQAHAKLGFRSDGRMVAADLFVIQENGPYSGFRDYRGFGNTTSILYQPENMRWRGIPVLCNTPPTTAQRGPGENQTVSAIEPLLDEAARELGLDRVEIRKVNAPDHDGLYGANRGPITSSYLREALDLGAKEFNWAEMSALSGQRNGTKITGVGVGMGYHAAGATGFDGLLVLRPDGKLEIHNGVGNLGTFSFAGTARVAAEYLGCSWDSCEIFYGDTRNNLPWNLGQFGSNSSYTMARTNYAAAMDAKRKLQEIAAMDLGGEPDDYDIADERVFLASDPTQGMSYAEAAQRAIELGGKYSGHELPEDLNPMTALSASNVAGQGLVGVAKDTYPHEGTVPGLAAGFARVEIDAETGMIDIVDYVGVADCGTVLHPQSLETQIKGAAVQGFGLAHTEKHAYDPELGLAANRGLYQVKHKTYLDVPLNMRAFAVNLPDLVNPVGSKGVGEPIMGAGSAALINAISDAIGHYFHRIPITTDMILNVLEDRPQSNQGLRTNVVQ